MALEKGKRLGPYEILSSLGSGGMGEVYRARDVRLDREVAVKVLPETRVCDADLMARFDREARVLAALAHPNILTIYDVGSESGLNYVVTELLEGDSLFARIKQSPLPWKAAIEIAIAVADGLTAAHSRGVIHRDLKPENIFITSNSVVKLLDFGLARQEQVVSDGQASHLETAIQDTSPGTMIGTIQYMSPEQVRGQVVDARSDIFSFGAVLYEMLVGCRPFSSSSAVDAIASILRDPAPDLLRNDLNIPPQLDIAIRRCLEKNPEDRYQSMQEVTGILKSILSGGSIVSARRLKAPDSLAVLPFEDENPESESEYIADGITDNLIHTLSQLPRLSVMARGTVFRYKGRTADPISVGRSLNVRAVLTGRIRHHGGDLCIQTELVDVLTGARLWGEDYTSRLEDLLSLEQEISLRIVEKLRIKTVRRKKRIQNPTENSEAYQLYLKGRFHWNKRTLEGFRRAIDYFGEAAHLDPNFALAYGGLADAYSFMGGYGYIPSREAYSKAKVEAVKALKLDPTLAEAYTSLGTVQYRYDWDWAGAEESFRKAIQLNPGYIIAHLWFGVFLVLTGRFPEGLAEVRKAMDLDPLSIVVHWTMGYVNYYARDYERAIEAGRRAIDLDPAFARVYVDIGLCLIQQGKNQEGIYEIQRGISLLERNPSLMATLSYAYAISGEKAEAERLLQDLIEEARRQYVSPYSYSLVCIGLGKRDEAFEWLEKAFETREDALVSLKVNPRFDSLRSDTRFQSMLRRIGLPL